MPFQSEAQRRFLWAVHPALAKKWAAEYPPQAPLPAHVKVAQALVERRR